MTGLPKSVRDRLAGVPAPSGHPDPDVLTAFAENALLPNERQQVMEHLAVCADCRDVAFLAQPETEQSQATVAPARVRGVRWMRWASVAAVVVVGSAVMLEHNRGVKEQAEPQIASSAPSTSVEQKTLATDKLEQPGVPAAEKRAEHAQVQAPAISRRDNSPKLKSSTEAQFATAPEKDEAAKASKESPVPTPAPPAAAPVPKGQVMGGVVARQNAAGPMQRDIQVSQQQQPAQGPSNSANGAITNVTVLDANANAPAAAPPSMAKAQRKEALQGSVNGVAGGYAPAPAAARRLAHVAPTRWRVSETGDVERSYGNDAWTAVLHESGEKFRVIATVRDTVWAGGNKGVLFVSRNDGNNWERVEINTPGDIVSIQFADVMSGVLQTADGETWKTSDGGGTWRKQ